MLSSSFKELNAEFGFSLQTPPQLVLSELKDDLRSIEGSYTQYLGLGSVIRLGSADFSQRLIKALALRLRTVFEAASNDVDMWSKSLTAPVDAQLRERKRSYTRRLEAVDRISGAATELEERIAEMENAQARLGMLQTQLISASAQLLDPIAAERQQAASMPSSETSCVPPFSCSRADSKLSTRFNRFWPDPTWSWRPRRCWMRVRRRRVRTWLSRASVFSSTKRITWAPARGGKSSSCSMGEKLSSSRQLRIARTGVTSAAERSSTCVATSRVPGIVASQSGKTASSAVSSGCSASPAVSGRMKV